MVNAAGLLDGAETDGGVDFKSVSVLFISVAREWAHWAPINKLIFTQPR